MPRPSSAAITRASLAITFAVGTAAVAFGQAPIFQEEYGLRSTLSPDTEARAERSSGIVSATGSPPGFGAGDTGFVSTNVAKPGAKSGKTTLAPQDEQPRATLSPAAATRAARVRRSPENDTTGSLPPPRTRPLEEEDPYAAVGFRAGSFDVRPSAEVSLGYDDNPFRTAGGRGSRFTMVAAKVETQSNWSRHELAGELRGAYTDYLQVPGNDRPEAEAKLRGRIDVTSSSRIEFEGRAALATEGAGSPDAVTAAKRPPNVYTFAGSAGLVRRFNRFEAILRGNVERNVYQDAELLSGAVQNLSDRDYVAYDVALRGSYEMTPGIKPFVEAGADRRVFDHDVDFDGVRRGSVGLQARAGVEFAREGFLSGEASAGFEHRRYRDPSLSDVSGLIVDSSLVWRATALTTITLTATSEIGETTLPGASGVFNRQAGVKIEHAFRRWLIGSASVTYGIEDYRGAGRRDDQLTLAAGITYHMNRYAALKAEVRREQLRSNVAGGDYTANVAMVGLRFQR